MEVFEDLSRLLHFEFVEDNLTLRIDSEGLYNFDVKEKSIVEITLKNAEVSKVFLENKLKNFIGLPLEYEISPNDTKQIFEFWVDYGVDSEKINFSEYQETNSSYTESDIFIKGKTLSKLYLNLWSRFDENESIHLKMSNKLKAEIEDDITRFERKAEFFEDKSSAYLQSIKSLQKLLNILETSND